MLKLYEVMQSYMKDKRVVRRRGRHFVRTIKGVTRG